MLCSRTKQPLPYHEPVADMHQHNTLDNVEQVYGVLGKPVAHSRSPQLHNAAMAAAGLDSLYLPLLVDDLPSFLHTYSSLDYGGFSVTIPHKASICPGIAALPAAGPVLHGAVPCCHLVPAASFTLRPVRITCSLSITIAHKASICFT